MEINEIYEKIVMDLDALAENEWSSQLEEDLLVFRNLWMTLSDVQKDEWMNKLIASVEKNKIISAVYVYSFVMYHVHSQKWAKELLEMVLFSTHLSKENLYFLYWQLFEYFMLWPECETSGTKILLWKLFQKICKMYVEAMPEKAWVDEKERNKQLVVVITTQILNGTLHGPTKTTLDRCKVLLEVMKKKVLLINTAEVASSVGGIPYCGQVIPTYCDELHDQEYIEWEGVVIPYFQCDNNMPNIDVLDILMNHIVQMKPAFVVEVGTGSVLANLVSKCFPVLSVVTGFSRLAITETQYQTSSLVMSDIEREILHQVGKEERHVLPCLFTFGLKEQQYQYKRAQLGVPGDKFVLAVVGTRLDFEIDDEFLKMLQHINNENIVVVYIGVFNRLKQILKQYPCLSDMMYGLGQQEDVLAVLEQCDLFVNPIRLGGGTSAAEALSKGVPVVSTSYGDVGATVGAEFWVKDYAQMAEVISRYQSDTDFYTKQSERAYKRAARLLDTAAEFVGVIKEFGNRMNECYFGE